MISILILSLTATYVLLVLAMAIFQRRMIYFPIVQSEAQARREAAAVGLAPWQAADGRLIGWRGPGRAGANRMLVLHGNGDLAHHRSYWSEGLEAGGPGLWEVFFMEFPGYGFRPGKPTEDSLLAAGREAMAELGREGDAPIYLAGISLGSGVATQLAADFPDRVAGVVLVTPFTSLADAAARLHPWMPVRQILSDHYDSLTALSRFNGSLAVLVAGRDRVVPAEQGRRLHAAFAGRKRLWEQAEASHNTLQTDPGAPWWPELSRFLLAAKAE